MIAVIREVAAPVAGYLRGANVKLGNWRQVTVRCKPSVETAEMTCENKNETHGNVYSHHLSYFRNYKCEKEAAIFYGKSSNENHTQGI